MKNFIVYISGLDRMGFISDISKEISHLNGNIETSKMIKLGEDFNMLILISLDPKHIDILKKSFKKYANLSFTIKEALIRENDSENKFIFRLKGADDEGIVHYCTELFSKLDINILDLETKVLNAPTTGAPLFYIKAIITTSGYDSTKELEKNILHIENEKNVVIKFSQYDESLNH